jgi:hypothetical protein
MHKIIKIHTHANNFFDFVNKTDNSYYNLEYQKNKTKIKQIANEIINRNVLFIPIKYVHK